MDTSTETLPADLATDVRLWRVVDAERKRIEKLHKEATARLVASIGVGNSVVVDGTKTTIAQQQQREVSLDQLQAVASRRLFANLTKRSINWSNWDSYAKLGKLPEAVASLVTRKPKAAYVVDGGDA